MSVFLYKGQASGQFWIIITMQYAPILIHQYNIQICIH